MNPPGQNGYGERISRLIRKAQDDYPQQGANGLGIGLRKVVMERAQGVLEQPQELPEGFRIELVRLGDDPPSRVATLEDEGTVGVEGKACEGEKMGHGDKGRLPRARDQAVALSLSLSLRSAGMAVPMRGRRGMTASSSSPWLGSRRLRPR